MDPKHSRKSTKKKEPSEGNLSLARPKLNKDTSLDTQRKSIVSSNKTNRKILPPVKHTGSRYLPPVKNSVQSHRITGRIFKDGCGKNPLELDRPAAVHQFVKEPSCDKQPNSEPVRDRLSPQLIEHFPAESFAFLEQLSQMQRIAVKKILKMKSITNLELLQKCRKITDWVTTASKDVVLPAVYLYQALTKDLYKKYTQKDLHPQWLCLGDGGISSAVNHEGIVSAANIFNALVCMTRTNIKQSGDSDESCLAYSGQSTPSDSFASHRKCNLLFCSHIRVNARELTQHIYSTLLNSHLGSIYICQSWWAMMTPDLAAKRNFEFLSDLLFNFIVYAVKSLLESFLGLPHKVPCNSSIMWTLKSRPGVCSTVSAEEQAALDALSEALISRVADVLSTLSETPLRAENGIGEDATSEDSSAEIYEDPIIYDDHLPSLHISGTPSASRSSCTSEGHVSITALSTQSSETDTGILTHSISSRTSTCIPASSRTASECNLNSAKRVESTEGLDSHSLKENCQIPCELPSPVKPSICWASDEVSVEVCSSDDLSPSNFTTSHQSSLSSDTDTADATVAEETHSERSQGDGIKQGKPCKSSDPFTSTQQHKSFETTTKTYPRGIVDVFPQSRQFHLSRAVSRLLCLNCRDASHEDENTTF